VSSSSFSPMSAMHTVRRPGQVRDLALHDRERRIQIRHVGAWDLEALLSTRNAAVKRSAECKESYSGLHGHKSELSRNAGVATGCPGGHMLTVDVHVAMQHYIVTLHAGLCRVRGWSWLRKRPPMSKIIPQPLPHHLRV
jgi:hypothetical protein